MKLRERRALISEINLSPILDLSLILIIFLAVTTEFISGGELKVKVPKGGAALNAQGKVVKVIVDKWGRLYYNGKEFKDPLKLAKELPKNGTIYVKADRDTPYKFVFTLLDTLRKEGIKKVSLVGQRVE
ncbi:ExbD/TolR family protein [Thermovibrio sp.]